MKEKEIHIQKEFLFEKQITVMKFGGSSVADAKCILHAAKITSDYAKEAPVVVVVSAMQGVTDKLYSIYDAINQGDLGKVIDNALFLEEQHQSAAHLIGANGLLNPALSQFWDDILRITQRGSIDPQARDFLVSYGERLSPLLFAAALKYHGKDAQAVDAGDVITTNGQFGNALVDLNDSESKARANLHPLIMRNSIPIVGGFYGASIEGKVTILGRGGSDYTAAALAHTLNARELILWKEVNGVYSADPKVDAEAQFYSELTYDTALLLATNGAKILHPEAMKPVAEKQIPVFVRNTFKPDFPGTKIWEGAL